MLDQLDVAMFAAAGIVMIAALVVAVLHRNDKP